MFYRSELLYLCKWRVLHLNLIAEQTTRFNYMLFNFLQEGERISRRLVPSLLLNKLASALMHVNCEVFLVWEWWGSDGLYLIARFGYELNLRPNLAIIFNEFRHCSHVIWVKQKYASEMFQFAAFHILRRLFISYSSGYAKAEGIVLTFFKPYLILICGS